MPDDNSGQFGSGLSFSGDQQPQPSPPQSGGFGSSFLGPHGSFFGPRYDPAPPGASPLDMAENQLRQQAERAQWIATNPWAQIFGGADEARKFIPQVAEKLQQIQKQRADIAAHRVLGQNLGLAPGEFSDQSTTDDMAMLAQAKARNGNIEAFNGLSAYPETKKYAEAVEDQYHASVAANLDTAQSTFDSLSNIKTDSEFRDAVQSMRTNGSLKALDALGLKLSDDRNAFLQNKGREAEALRNARIGVDTIGQKLEARNTQVPMQEAEEKAYSGRLTTPWDPILAGKWSRSGGPNGTPGIVVNGLDMPNKIGRGAVLGNDKQRQDLMDQSDKIVPKDEREKARGFSRLTQLATYDKDGNKLPDGQINSNSIVQQGISEGFAAMLREGAGGANKGLVGIEEDKRGYLQQLIDKIQTEKATVINQLKGSDVAPYISKLSQVQKRYVLDMLKNYNDHNTGDRLSHVAERAGALGFSASDIGFGEGENSVIDASVERGRQAMIARMTPFHQAIGGGDGKINVGAQRPDAGAVSTPAGYQNRIQYPGAPPLQTPVQQQREGNNPSPPGTPSPSASPQGPSASQGVTNAGASGGGGPVQPGTGPNGYLPGRYYGNNVVPMEAAKAAIAKMESGGNYGAVTQSRTPLGRALGKYQVMEGELPDQLKQAGLAPMTPEQFLKNPWAQEKLFETVFGEDMRRHASFDEAAGRWFAGPNWRNKSTVTDAMGTTPPKYLRNVNATLSNYMTGNAGSGRSPVLDAQGNPLPSGPGAPVMPSLRQSILDPLTKGWGFNPRSSVNPTPSGGLPTLPKPAAEAETAPPTGKRYGPGGNFLANRGAGMAESPAATYGPEIGTGVGNVVGGAVGGPAGFFAGGGFGGAAGQYLKDWLLGNPQEPLEIARQGGLGLATSIMPGGSTIREIGGAAARVGGAAAVEGATRAAQGGDAGDVAESAMQGATGVGLGEAAGRTAHLFGRALGMVGHKLWSLLSPEAQDAIQSAAKKFYDAGEVLKTEPNKLPGAAGKPATPNPKYDAAQQARDEAQTVLKDASIDPESAAYAHKVTQGEPSTRMSVRVAEANKPGDIEKERLQGEYRSIEEDVQAQRKQYPTEHLLGTDVPGGRLKDGPNEAVANGNVSPKFTYVAQRTEQAIQAPADNWRIKWQQLQKTRSALLKAEDNLRTGKAVSDMPDQDADDLRALADTVRNHQVKVANYVFGPKQGPEVIARLQKTDQDWRNLLDSTNNFDLEKAARMTGEAGRTADVKFRAFAKGDPVALAAWNHMRGKALSEAGGAEAADVRGLYHMSRLEKVPILGKVFAAGSYLLHLKEWAQERAAGSPVRFQDLIPELRGTSPRVLNDLVGSAGARTGSNYMRPDEAQPQQAPQSVFGSGL